MPVRARWGLRARRRPAQRRRAERGEDPLRRAGAREQPGQRDAAAAGGGRRLQLQHRAARGRVHVQRGKEGRLLEFWLRACARDERVEEIVLLVARRSLEVKDLR